MTKRLAMILILCFLIPSLFSFLFLPESLISPVSAASCNSNNHEPIWGVEAANLSLEDNMYYYYEGGKGEPIEPYYDEGPSFEQRTALGTLTQDDDFGISQVLKNDS